MLNSSNFLQDLISGMVSVFRDSNHYTISAAKLYNCFLISKNNYFFKKYYHY